MYSSFSALNSECVECTWSRHTSSGVELLIYTAERDGGGRSGSFSSPVSTAWAPLSQKRVGSLLASEEENIKGGQGKLAEWIYKGWVNNLVKLCLLCIFSHCAASSHLVDVRERRKYSMCCTSFKHLLYLVCHHFRSYLCQPSECVSLASSPCDSTWNMHTLPQVWGWGWKLIWNAGDGRPKCWSPIFWIFDGVNEQENTGLSTLLVCSWNNGGGRMKY